jgi:hypothetical protein
MRGQNYGLTMEEFDKLKRKTKESNDVKSTEYFAEDGLALLILAPAHGSTSHVLTFQTHTSIVSFVPYFHPLSHLPPTSLENATWLEQPMWDLSPYIFPASARGSIHPQAPPIPALL